MTPKTGERLFAREYGKVLFGIAQDDLESAKGLAKSGLGRPETVIFQCQQAIEKALKAVLCAKLVPVPLIHDFGALVAKMPDGVEPPYSYGLSRYNDFAGILRYERGHTKVTQADIDAALQVAAEVISWAAVETK